jgi:hypothetical protein
MSKKEGVLGTNRNVRNYDTILVMEQTHVTEQRLTMTKFYVSS